MLPAAPRHTCPAGEAAGSGGGEDEPGRSEVITPQRGGLFPFPEAAGGG